MAFWDPFTPYLTWELSQWEVYGLFFLLGSFAVATVSDVKHLSAQREFMDVWFAFTGVLFLLDLWAEGWVPAGPFLAKWVLILVLGALSHRAVGGFFRLATADVAAVAAASALLSPILIVVFYGAMKVASVPVGRLLARSGGVYPFLPVVTAASLAVLALGWLTNPAMFGP